MKSRVCYIHESLCCPHSIRWEDDHFVSSPSSLSLPSPAPHPHPPPPSCLTFTFLDYNYIEWKSVIYLESKSTVQKLLMLQFIFTCYFIVLYICVHIMYYCDFMFVKYHCCDWFLFFILVCLPSVSTVLFWIYFSVISFSFWVWGKKKKRRSKWEIRSKTNKEYLMNVLVFDSDGLFHSVVASWFRCVQCGVTSTESTRTINDGEPRTATSAQLLGSVTCVNIFCPFMFCKSWQSLYPQRDYCMGTGIGWTKTQHKSGGVKKRWHKEEYGRSREGETTKICNCKFAHNSKVTSLGLLSCTERHWVCSDSRLMSRKKEICWLAFEPSQPQKITLHQG